MPILPVIPLIITGAVTITSTVGGLFFSKKRNDQQKAEGQAQIQLAEAQRIAVQENILATRARRRRDYALGILAMVLAGLAVVIVFAVVL